MVTRSTTSRVMRPTTSAVTGTGVSGVAANLTEGLIALWKMDEASGDRVDEVGSLALAVGGGTVDQGNGRVFAAGSLTKNARFSGLTGTDNSWLQASHNAALSFGDSSWTMCCWVNARNVASSPFVVSKTGEYVLAFNGTSNRLRFGLSASSLFTYVSSDIDPVNFEWLFVEAYFDASQNEIGLRINNEHEYTGEFSGTPDTTTNGLFVGSSAGSANFLRGAVQELGFWNRLLTAQERSQLWNNGFGNQHPFDARVSLSSYSSVLRSDALLRDDKTSTRGESPNCGYSAEPSIFSRTISTTTYQVCSYWNKAAKLVIGVRSKTSGNYEGWTWHVTNESLASDFDNHETITIAIDADGVVHVCYDTRNGLLRYAKSNASLATWDGTLTTGLSFTGSDEDNMAYPMFFVDGSGGLHVTYRDGGSGAGDQYLKSYSTGTDSWSDAVGTTAGLIMDGLTNVPDYNPYIFRSPEVDSTGLCHFAWNWRASSLTSSDVDIHHARWNPSTGAWTTMTGASLSVPFKPPGSADYATSRIAEASGTNTGLEPGDICLDSNDIPHLVTASAIGEGVTNLWHYYFDGVLWKQNKITDRASTFWNDMQRPICFCTPNDTLAILYLDAEVYSDQKPRFIYAEAPFVSWTAKVYENIALGDGDDLAFGPLGGYDRRELAESGQLYLFTMMAQASNGDGIALLSYYSNIDAFLPIPQTAPEFVVNPSISGSAVEGETLTANSGVVSGSSPISKTFQWKRDNVAIDGATSSTYLLTEADVGTVITVTETATNAFGSALATSAGTSTISAAFTPESISNLVHWFSAYATDSLLVSLSPDTAATDGQTVTRWVDQSLNASDANQGFEGPRPTLDIDGLESGKTLSFDGTDDRFELANETPGSYTFAFVVRRDAGAARMVLYLANAGTAQQLISFENDTSISIFRGSFLNSSTIDPTVPIIAVCVFNDTASLIRVNGTQVASGAVGTRATTSTARTISRNTDPFGGQLSVFLEWHKVLTTEEIEQVEAYLSSISGVALDP